MREREICTLLNIIKGPKHSHFALPLRPWLLAVNMEAGPRNIRQAGDHEHAGETKGQEI